jgi:uncharacterized membrane protein YphA (DoxX/SURF4 family)
MPHPAALAGPDAAFQKDVPTKPAEDARAIARHLSHRWSRSVSMEKLITPGRLVFAVAIAAFGVEAIVCARSGGDFLPVIPWLPANQSVAYLSGSGLLAAALYLALNVRPRLAAILLGAFFLGCGLVLQVPKAVSSPLDIGIRTLVFEPFALAGAALAWAETLPPAGSVDSRWTGILDGFLRSGRFLFAASLVVFGVSHFLVPRFIASLIPAWMPGRLFWAFFTGAGFVAAGLSIATRWLDRWAAALIGTMFLLWFLLLHAPRVLRVPGRYDPDEWSSAFIALGMCGASWLLIRRRAVEAQPGS